MFPDSECHAGITESGMPEESNLSTRDKGGEAVQLSSDLNMVASSDNKCHDLRRKSKDCEELAGSAAERMSTYPRAARTHPDDRCDEENGGLTISADECGTHAGSVFVCAVNGASSQFPGSISSNSSKTHERTTPADIAPETSLGQLSSCIRESSEFFEEAMGGVEGGAALPPIKDSSTALFSSSRERASRSHASSITNGHSEDKPIDLSDFPSSPLTVLPSDSDSERTRKTPSQVYSNRNMEHDRDVLSGTEGQEATPQVTSDASHGSSSTSDATSSEICSPRSSKPSPRLIMDCVIPPPFSFPKKLYRPMSEVHPEMVASSDVKSADESKKAPIASERPKREDNARHRRHRFRSPLHKHNERQALELFGSSIATYSCFGHQGGLQIARAVLQCVPEDQGRASFGFPMTDELRRSLEEGMAEARGELAEINHGAASTAKPQVLKQGTKVKRKLKAKEINDCGSSERSNCHGCAKKTNIPKMECCAVRSNGTLCTARFCELCINRKYPDIHFDVERADFTCPRCSGTCLCASCSRARDSRKLNRELGLKVNAGPSRRRTTNGPEDRKAKTDDRYKKQNASVNRPSVDDSNILFTEDATRKRPLVRDSQRSSNKGKPPGIRPKAGGPRSRSPIAKRDAVDETHLSEGGEDNEQGPQDRLSVLGAASGKQASGSRAFNERPDAKFDDDCEKDSEPINAHSRFGRAIKPTEKTRRSSRNENGEPEVATRQRKRRRTDSISARNLSSSDHPATMQILLGSPTSETHPTR